MEKGVREIFVQFYLPQSRDVLQFDLGDRQDIFGDRNYFI